MAQDLITKARANPNFVNVFTDYDINAPQLYADVDRVQAKRLGVPLAGVFQTMQTYLGSYYINDFNRFGRTYRVIAQAEESFRDRPEDIMLLKTRNAAGAMVPLAPCSTCATAMVRQRCSAITATRPPISRARRPPG